MQAIPRRARRLNRSGLRLETDHTTPSGQCQYYTRQTFAEAAGELFEILDSAGSYVEDSPGAW